MDDEEFYFESDHLALRGNKDYLALLRVVLILESQKVMLVKDIENLESFQKAALLDPLQFVQRLKEGKVEFPPSTYSFPELPSINWSNYGVTDTQLSDWTNNVNKIDNSKSNHVLVRGRTFDQSKPETFNQLWTYEEQRRLEELLVEYPEEEIEMRRWVKIAKALGNRTSKQVMSRVQKYFIKLQQAGLPVPGRVRKIQTKGVTHRHQKSNRFAHRKSTFFPSQDVPVFMDEDNVQIERNSETKNNLVTLEQWTPLELMEAVYERKKIEENSNLPQVVHTGVTCIGCCCKNIIGTRWTDNLGSDWCTDCLIEYQPTSKMTPVTSIHFKENEDYSVPL